ncbi:hypothetical protein [Sulfolobus acidocaldarius]|uniref:PIN domain-containing protein n=4 Tax=Sulfolobus acidocaldarius TaxID=2285 RepID=Q4J7C4_SULAC|nr:hypothetical protein [Sulfolobus acidocaldarius]AAY81301.1 hypothetical protein Saci_2002 [Sulfolobus acidocaldarius DSM 639]AGE71939.1 hypothetical protein SacN8_09925 [Sulfolobus acidocaldarius N8]AGE74211.1 hypothetical protein SacRon12I_09945 [Sulfolobus acidocaldarius Ron12/I]ALU29896.1 hypothetical protein ATY89_08065 [Sulfolobus acidocaldarius]ALU32637.1 hypothetical protein ATZ20_11085 [Sulfolobus acidocaldarius]
MELTSYLSRNINDNPLPYVLKVINDFNLTVSSPDDSYVKMPYLGKVRSVVAVSLIISQRVKLRTLDLLHVSYDILLRVKEFVTADKEFAKAKDVLDENGINLKIIV